MTFPTEIRWLIRNEPYMNFIVNKVKVLQYRELVGGRWTEWRDVPVVDESKK